MPALHMIVRGTVQGVAFRYSTRERALDLNLEGWVRNRKDGSVEIFVQGDKEQVNLMKSWAQTGPSQAVVEELIASPQKPDQSIQGFVVRTTC
ncbi:acylphosphatase [Tindallia magadiensis]|uniref:Acylphosphatase n=1 Tax=Tindallia magadiensis TaxID=69895 RepID=A0A1I3FY47_9FIRM|nr:acylphosphatase [Tindallia magadiensis]SFI16119.1 acylphosphatase [Tindallia magadiensis]